MSQVLSIRFPAALSSGQISGFLAEWEQIGTWEEQSDRVFELRPHVGEHLLLNCQETDLEIMGYPEFGTFEFIEAYAGRNGGELLYEGESMTKVQAASEEKMPGAIPTMRGSIGGAFSMLLTLAMFPVFALIFVARLSFIVVSALLGALFKKRA